jgi:hypothetical protein
LLRVVDVVVDDDVDVVVDDDDERNQTYDRSKIDSDNLLCVSFVNIDQLYRISDKPCTICIRSFPFVLGKTFLMLNSIANFKFSSCSIKK